MGERRSDQCAPHSGLKIPSPRASSPPPCSILGLGKLIAVALSCAQSLLEAHGKPVVSVCSCFYLKVRACQDTSKKTLKFRVPVSLSQVF